jgi:hypothetical protein
MSSLKKLKTTALNEGKHFFSENKKQSFNHWPAIIVKKREGV